MHLERAWSRTSRNICTPGGARAGRPSRHASREMAVGTSRLERLGARGRGWHSGSSERRRGHLVHRWGRAGTAGGNGRDGGTCVLLDSGARGGGKRGGMAKPGVDAHSRCI
jgi:hypothetical protein